MQPKVRATETFFKHIMLEFEDFQNLSLKSSSFPELTKLASSVFLL